MRPDDASPDEGAPPARPTKRPPYLHIKKSGDGRWRAAYRRQNAAGDLFRRPLPLPGSEGFQAAYDAAHAEYLRERARPGEGLEKPGTVAAAVSDYLRSEQFKGRDADTRRQYRYHLDLFRAEFGHLAMRSIDWAFVDGHRTKWWEDGRVNTWNEIRKAMAVVTQRWMNKHEGKLAANPWERHERLPVEKSTQNRRWPEEVISAVLHAATPQFRALLLVYIFTGNRGGDAVRFGDEEAVSFDSATRILKFVADKGGMEREMIAPESLARLLTGLDGRSLLLTPRGRAWTLDNAQGTLRDLLTNLGLPRYTLHGLRATVASTLGEEGFSELVLKAQGGWKDSRTVQVYLEGIRQRTVQRPAAQTLEARFGPLVSVAEVDGNAARASGVTGRAAAKAGIEGRARDRRRKAKARASEQAKAAPQGRNGD